MSHQDLTPRLAVALAAALGLGLAFVAPAQAATIDIPVADQTLDAFSSDAWPNDDDDVNGLGGWKFVYDNSGTGLPAFPGGTVTLGGVDYELDYGAEVNGSTDQTERAVAQVGDNSTLTIDIADQAYFDVSFLYATFDNQDDAEVTVNYTDATKKSFGWDVIGTQGFSQSGDDGTVPAGAAWYGDVELLKMQNNGGGESNNVDRGFVGQTFSVDSAKTVDSITFEDPGGSHDTLIMALSGSPVPEPATLALLGLGGAVMLSGRKRRA